VISIVGHDPYRTHERLVVSLLEPPGDAAAPERHLSHSAAERAVWDAIVRTIETGYTPYDRPLPGITSPPVRKQISDELFRALSGAEVDDCEYEEGVGELPHEKESSRPFLRMRAVRGVALPDDFVVTIVPECDPAYRDWYVINWATRSMKSNRSRAVADMREARTRAWNNACRAVHGTYVPPAVLFPGPGASPLTRDDVLVKSNIPQRHRIRRRMIDEHVRDPASAWVVSAGLRIADADEIALNGEDAGTMFLAVNAAAALGDWTSVRRLLAAFAQASVNARPIKGGTEWRRFRLNAAAGWLWLMVAGQEPVDLHARPPWPLPEREEWTAREWIAEIHRLETDGHHPKPLALINSTITVPPIVALDPTLTS
jgi:hypothetical protein